MDTDVLAQLIEAKRQLLEQLHQLAVRQSSLVEAEDMTRLLSLLAVKQRLLESLQAVEQQLAPFYEEDPEQRPWPTPERRQEARLAADRCNELLGLIMQVEQGCDSRLRRRRDEAATRLHHFHASQHVTQAYLDVPGESGGQFDASCET